MMRSVLVTRLTIGTALLAALWTTAGVEAQKWRKPNPKPPAKISPVRITRLLENGGRLDWSERNNLIAFDRRVGDGFFDIYTMTPSASDITCLTCGKPDLPPKSKGNPSWHPSGEYIVFQAQNTYAGLGAIARPLGRITDYFANPGAGINNDIWVIDRQGRRFWQLTHVQPKVGGVLHPQFSRAGDKLFWSERISLNGPWGEWALRVGDFVIGRDGVRLENVRTLQPGAQRRMYESHGFSPDGRQVLFSGNLERGQAETSGDIYLYDLGNGQLKNLTNTQDEWDEHAHFSPDGKTIVWMTSKDLPGYRSPRSLKTDYWLMNPDGSNKRRLTYFNVPGYPEYVKSGITAADPAWSPDGSRIAAYVISDVGKGGPIFMLELHER